jgi:hypothetical protein
VHFRVCISLDFSCDGSERAEAVYREHRSLLQARWGRCLQVPFTCAFQCKRSSEVHPRSYSKGPQFDSLFMDLPACPKMLVFVSVDLGNLHFVKKILHEKLTVTQTDNISPPYTDFLCSLMFRLLRYRSRGPGSIPCATRCSENGVHSAS